MTNSKTRDITIVAAFIAVMIAIQVASQLIYAVWPFPIKPTLLHVPVIVGSLLLGWKKGALLGLVFGLISTTMATLMPGPTSFLFSPFTPVIGSNEPAIWGLLIAIVPRVLIGITPALVYSMLKNKLGLAVGGFVGTATNTILVLSAIYFIYGSLLKWQVQTILATIVSTNTLMEVLIAVVLTPLITTPLQKIIQ